MPTAHAQSIFLILGCYHIAFIQFDFKEGVMLSVEKLNSAELMLFVCSLVLFIL